MIVLGVILFVFFRNFWINEKKSTLRSEVNSVSVQIEQMKGLVNYEHQVRRLLSALNDPSGGTIFVTDLEGKIEYASEWELVGHQLSEKYVNEALQSEYDSVGKIPGIVPESSYIYGIPITEGGEEVGVVFATIPSAGLGFYLATIMRIFILAAIIVGVLAFCAVYLVSARLVRPVREMAEAAQNMSHGDFSKYIHIDGYKRNDEIGQLAIAFNNMTRSLADGEKVRRGFVANVSHELKTPMTTISGFVDGVLDGTIPEENQDYYLKIVSNEVKRLSRLVVAMLNLSKLESGEMKLSPKEIDLSRITVDIAVGFEQLISEKNINILGLENLEEQKVVADRDLMYQAIYNLIDNAIKYTPENGVIGFKSERYGNVVKMTIRNSGNGIPEAEMRHIFDRFYKVDKSRSVNTGSSGLGLFLVKTIISLHGGEITVNSVEGQYTEFVYSIPEKPDTDIIEKKIKEGHRHG